MTIWRDAPRLGGLAVILLPMLAVGCAGRFCADPCHPHGSTYLQHMAGGDCRPCGQAPGCHNVARHPLDHLRVMLTSGGCGELYIDEWISDPPACCDPCNQCGQYVGPRYCPQKKNRLTALAGGRVGCNVCPATRGPGGCGGFCSTGGCGDCGMGGGCGPCGGCGSCGGGCSSCGTELFMPGCGAEPTCGCGDVGCGGGCGPVDYRMAAPTCTSCSGGMAAAPAVGGCSSCGTGGVDWAGMYGG